MTYIISLLFFLISAGLAFADEPRACADTIAIPGSISKTYDFYGDDGDLIVIAPGPNSSYRFCFFNSTVSEPTFFDIQIDGMKIRITISVHRGPETYKIELPGVIVTDLNGVPLTSIWAVDDDEINGYLFLGVS